MAKVPAAPKMTAAERRAAVEAIRQADLLIQDFRAAFVKLTFTMAMREDLDPLRHAMEKTEGWRIHKRALERSPAVMAALRPFWNPEDEVRVP